MTTPPRLPVSIPAVWHALLLGLWGAACLALALPSQARPLGARGEHFLYRVEPGDTLEQLARRYTLQPANWTILQDLNHVEDPYRLMIGKVLQIPLALIPEQAASATVVHVTGQVSADGRALQEGDRLLAGQQVRSAPGASATLQLQDQSLLTVEPDAALHIRHLNTFQGTGLTDTILEMQHGTVESIVAPEDTGVGRFEVRTPAVVTGVRGTRLRVRTDQAGSRVEVLRGQAAADGRAADTGQAATEQAVGASHGAAYDQTGRFLGTRALLPAPVLHASRRAGTGWELDFEAVPQASAYRVQVALDPAGAALESSRLTDGPAFRVTARGAGERHVFVNAIDTLGIEGMDAIVHLHFLFGLTSSDGLPVLSGDGNPVALGAE